MTTPADAYASLIASSRVSPQTRSALQSRLAPDDPAYVPKVLTPDQLLTLRHVTARLIPQYYRDGVTQIDLAARLDAKLSEAEGDGWRYATLPSDSVAFSQGLELLDEFATSLSKVPFHRLALTAQDSLLTAIASQRIHSPKLDLHRWFEDLRANTTQIYVSHPQTLADMGYSGIADDPNGFVQLGIGKREAWEPESR